MTQEKNKALKSIFKGASIVFIGVIISKLLGLIFRVLVGRTLGPAEYGVITVTISVFAAAETFGHMGIHKGVQRYMAYYRGEGDREKMVSTARTGYLLIMIPSILVGVLLWFLAPWLSNSLFNEPKLLWPIRMVAVTIPFWGIAKICIKITNALEMMQYKVYISKIWANVTKVVLALALIYAGYGYLGAAFAYAFGVASSAIVGLYFVKKVFPELFSFKKTGYNVEELWYHSWPLFAAGIIATLSGHIDTFMLQYFETSESVGIYNAAYPFAALLLVGHRMFNAIFLSRASYLKSKSEQDLQDTFKVVIKWISLITVPVFLLLFAYPRSLLFLFGDQYFAAENVLRILLLGFLLNALLGPATKVYQAYDRTKIVTVISVISGVLNVGLNLALIPLYGIIGAAIATSLTFFIIALVKIYFLYQVTGAFPFRKSILKILAAGTLSISFIVLISNLIFETTPLWFLIPAFAAFAATYLLTFILLRGIEEEDIEIIEAIEQKTGKDLNLMTKIMKRFSN